MVFCVFIFIFLFRNNVIREQLDENENWMKMTYGNVFSKVSFRKYLITAMFKVLYQQLRGTLTTSFERHLLTEDFTDIGVKLAPRYLTNYSMALFLSNKRSF